MTDLDRAVTAAIARKVRDAAGADPDVAAVEIMAIVRGYGFRLVCPPPDDWRHGGADPDGPGKQALARARAERGW